VTDGQTEKHRENFLFFAGKMYLAICVSADQGSFWFLFNVKFTNHEDEEMRENSSHFFVFTDILHYYSDALLFFSLSAKLQCSLKQ